MRRFWHNLFGHPKNSIVPLWEAVGMEPVPIGLSSIHPGLQANVCKGCPTMQGTTKTWRQVG